MTATSSTRSIVRKSLNILFVSGALTMAILASASGAEAKPDSPDYLWTPALGLGVGLLAGAAAAAAYGPGCHWMPQYDLDGYYVGRVRVCR